MDAAEKRYLESEGYERLKNTRVKVYGGGGGVEVVNITYISGGGAIYEVRNVAWRHNSNSRPVRLRKREICLGR